MCLTSRREVSIEKVEAWKTFAVEKGELFSPFSGIHDYMKAELGSSLAYKANERIKVVPDEAVFFAFKEFKSAASIANNRRTWAVISSTLIVLPVTLYNVCAEGKLWEPSGDPQCFDYYHEAYESKEIEVHDSAEIRANVSQKIVEKYLKKHEWSMSYLEKQAFSHLLK